MIKWLGMMAAVVLVVGLSGCTGEDSSSDEATATPAASPDAAPDATPEATPAKKPMEGSGAKLEVPESPAAGEATSAVLTSLEAQTVGVACGVCVYEMEGDGCPIAAEVGGEKFFITFADGVEFDTHGKGLCKADTNAQAKVSGELKDGELVLSSLELLTD